MYKKKIIVFYEVGGKRLKTLFPVRYFYGHAPNAAPLPLKSLKVLMKKGLCVVTNLSS